MLVSSEVYKIQPIRFTYQKPGNMKFYALLKINIQKREGLPNFEKNDFWFCCTIYKKEGFKQEIKVFTLDIRIKQSELKVSHSKVPSSDIPWENSSAKVHAYAKTYGYGFKQRSSKDCLYILKWLIYNSNLWTFIWSIVWKISSFL